MSPRTADHAPDLGESGPGRLQVAATGRLHVALDGRALCGRAIEPADLYSEDAGLRAWNDGPLERCAKCARALAERVRRAPRRRAASAAASASR